MFTDNYATITQRYLIFIDPGTIWHYFRPDQNDGSAAICGLCNELIHYFYNENDKGSLRLHFMRVHEGRFVQMNQIQDDWFSSNSTGKRKIIINIIKSSSIFLSI